MDFGKVLKTAMVANDINSAKQLSELSGISYNKVNRALNSDNSSRLVDVVKLANTLNLKIKFEVNKVES